MRPRRSCHAVPGSSERFLAKAAGLEADEVFLDLEDAVAASEKERARELVIQTLRESDFGGKTVVVRVNGTDAPHYYRDLIDVVEQAGDRLDAVMLPKVRTPGDVEMTAKLLTQIELARDLEPGRIGIEAQIEDATGLLACEAIAAASPRMETLIFGPGDYSAAVGIPITTIGGAPEHYPGDHLNYVFSRLVVAARAAGIQAIDGPYAAFDDDEGLRARARLARALGMDGKWTIHPRQIATVNEVFTPARDEWERAEALLAAYREATEQRPWRGDVRGRDDRRGEPPDGGAPGRGGPRRRLRGVRGTVPLRRRPDGAAAPAWRTEPPSSPDAAAPHHAIRHSGLPDRARRSRRRARPRRRPPPSRRWRAPRRRRTSPPPRERAGPPRAGIARGSRNRSAA